MTDITRSERKVPCPTCKRPAVFSPANPWRPFCSERCRSADLGAWASEQFRVVAPPSADELDADGAATGAGTSAGAGADASADASAGAGTGADRHAVAPARRQRSS